MFLKKEKEDVEPERKFVPNDLNVSERIIIDLTTDDDD